MNLSRFLTQPSLVSSQLRLISSSCALNKNQSARYKVTPKRDRPLTYEMANPPHQIAHRKSWNSWNVSNLHGQNIREAQTLFEDIFIRKFMAGTFQNLLCSEVIIKRQFNTIRIASIIHRGINARKMYFLIGYTEELLANWLQCPITLEIQTIPDKKDVVFKYI